jgi:membrane protease YdiL (CAAX protease family)
MLDLRRAFKWAAAAFGSTFTGTWAAVAPLIVAFKADLAAGEQAAIAGASALAAAAVIWAGNLIRQWRENARWTAEQVARNLNAGL